MNKEFYITAQTYYDTQYRAYLHINKMRKLSTQVLNFVFKYSGHIIKILTHDEFLEEMDMSFYNKKWQDEMKEEV